MQDCILLDHPLSYALTATIDVLVVYLQQIWQTIHKVPDTKDTIRFKLNTQEITYTMDLFRDTLKLSVETLDNLFITPLTIKTIESFMQTISYQGVANKVSALYTKNLAQPWQTMFKVFNRCQCCKTRVKQIGQPWSTSINGGQRQSTVVKLAGNLIILPEVPKTHCKLVLITYSKQKKIDEGEKVAQSYDDVDDFKNRLEPGSHKENPKYVNDDDDKEEEKLDKEEGNEIGSLEIRTEKMQTPIPTTPKSPRIKLSLDKNIFQELTNTVSPLTSTTSKALHKKKRISSKYIHLPELSAAKHKLMLLDTNAERRLMLSSQDKIVNDNYCC
nr:hypothetical protein [Tanacetum cinerariifolium]